MRLKQIKLVGFKSFVDATTVPFPQQMTAIVGPNGCGKSNIIDAVRWVLGESSAKNLRGDAMTDVIFNGSSARKPVFQASVELVFDNSEGRLEGSLAGRNEISVKRLVTRDATNSYFLNGSKCRRRDITDIFLGTGLGPRSYAIIEQGTISRLIESKPQELRVFVEEAAGISKYKERRRETETRIRATRDNLERLNDVRFELGQQIEKLHRQAEAAKRFKQLKAEERKLKAELAVLKWQKYNDKSQHFQQYISQAQTELERLISEQRSQESSILSSRQMVEEANETVAVYQQQKFLLASDISRLEQTVKHAKQLQASLAQDLQRVSEAIRLGKSRIADEQQLQEEAQWQVDELVPALDDVVIELTQVQEVLAELNESQRQWQQTWQKYTSQNAAYSEKVAVNNNKIQAHTELMARTEQSLEQQKSKLEETNRQLREFEQDYIQQELEDVFAEKANKQDELQNIVDLVEQLIQQQELLKENLSQSKLQQKALLAKLEVLQSLENNEAWQQTQSEWLTVNSEQPFADFIESVTIESGWESAAQSVLKNLLGAKIIPFSLLQKSDLPQQYKWIFDLPAPETNLFVDNSLAQKITGCPAISSYLANVLCVETDQEAFSLYPGLTKGFSILSKQGMWLNEYWALKGEFEQKHNQFLQHQQIKDLQHNLSQIEQSLVAVQQQNDDVSQRLTSQIQLKQTIQLSINELLQKEAQLKQQDALNQQKFQQLTQQQQEYQYQICQITQQFEEEF